MNIAMWSGPRNISTAMMYAFAARDDCAVWDEPFYAAYLSITDIDHPLRREILQAGIKDPNAVIRRCSRPAPTGQPVFYQKHMTQHMIPGIDRQWIQNCTNVFLIRDPARVIASYSAKRENPELDDIGFRQQAEIFDLVCELTGSVPAVLDSHRIRENPETALRKLCAAVDLPFQNSMLHWPTGGNENDGVWAKHWYGAVWNSTGFAGVEGPIPDVPADLQPVLKEAQPYYDKLAKYAL